jgi:hypothetical protein
MTDGGAAVVFAVWWWTAAVCATSANAPDTQPRRVVERHIGRWNSPPRKCPSSMVTDGPLLGNGDMGAAIGGACLIDTISIYNCHFRS